MSARCEKTDWLGLCCVLVAGHPPSCTGSDAGAKFVFATYPNMVWRPDEEPKMSDFKVGDVVRVTVEGKWFGVVGTISPERPQGIGRYTFVVRHNPEFAHIECSLLGPGRSYWMASGLSLVSRPGEAKHKRGCSLACAFMPHAEHERKHQGSAADRRECNLTCTGLAFYTPEAHERWHRDNDKPPAPALKVGDRVRVKVKIPTYGGRQGTVGAQTNATQGWPWTVKLDGDHSERGFGTAELELLPPEPASNEGPYRYDPTHTCDCNPLGQIGHPCVCRLRAPMTATEASIKMMRDIINSMALPREMLEGHAHRAPAPDSGWMPAGTYMPLKAAEPIKLPPPSRAKMLPQNGRVVAGIDYPSRDGRGSTLKQSIPERSRSLLSQTAQWGPYDTWDTLEDA